MLDRIGTGCLPRTGWTRAIATIALAACAAGGHAQQTDDGPGNLDDALRPIVEQHGVPSLVIMAVRGGDVIAQGAVGVRRAGRDEPITLDDRWHIGSCAKSMTATLAARLVEAGHLKWTSTIGETIGTIDSLKGRLLPEYHGVTLRQLLAHRSGLPQDRAPDPDIWPRIMSLRGPMIEQRREAAAIVLARKPAAAPGSVMAYSNFGYVVAAAMMEHATGQSWEDLITAHLFEPLGIASAGFGPPGNREEGQTATQPRGHRMGRGRAHAIEPGTLGSDNPAVLRPAGGVHLALRDWGRYAAAHVAGARGEATTLLRPESWVVLHADEQDQGYALGWGLGERAWAGGRVLTHDGSNSLWMAAIWLAPERNLAVLAATNIGGDAAAAACDQAVVQALKALDLLAPQR